jgi:TctA family transporter
MEFLGNILIGFQITFQPINLFYCFVGVFLGTMIGVLPGIGPSATIMEQSMRQSLKLSGGSFLIFLTRPVSAILLILAGLLLLSYFFFKREREVLDKGEKKV